MSVSKREEYGDVVIQSMSSGMFCHAVSETWMEREGLGEKRGSAFKGLKEISVCVSSCGLCVSV